LFKNSTSTWNLVRALYRDDYGNPFEMTPSQNKIFDCIFKKQAPDGRRRIHIETFTQYGKSEIVSMAVLTRASTYPEKWPIVAPSQAKAKIIMNYVIKHLFENEYTISAFIIEPGESLERLRRERSASRLTFNVGNNQIGQIFILSAESRLKSKEDIGNSLMGFGASNLIKDEDSLIDDRADAKAMRMVGGFSSTGDDFVVALGNPFRRNHFLKSRLNPKYYKIIVDYKKGLEEGRLSKEFVEEMKSKPYFSVLYECKFPEVDEIDEKGWIPLLSEEDIRMAVFDKKLDEKNKEKGIQHIGERRIGHDVARGGSNYAVWVMRSMNYASILGKSKSDNLMQTGAQTMEFMRNNEVLEGNVFIDEVGVGAGEVDHLRDNNIKIRAVNVGNRAIDRMRFVNIRAEAYWRLREWIKRGGRLSNNDEWYELINIKYRPDSKGRLKIMSKEEMRARGIDSPDFADSLALTFVRPIHGDIEKHQEMRKMKKRKFSFNKGLAVTMGGYIWMFSIINLDILWNFFV